MSGPSSTSDQILEALQHPVIAIDRSSDISYANATAAASFGGWIVGSNLIDIFPSFLRSAVDDNGVSMLRLTTSRDVAYEALFNPMGDDQTSVSFWPCSAAAMPAAGFEHDDLTGLARRNTFMAALSHHLAQSEGDPGSLAVHCIDLDRFKTVNDTLGHGIGDQLLKKVADRLRVTCRKDDVIARIGGDEFVILQPGISGAQDATRLATRLVDLIGRTYVLNGHTVNIGVSIGVALNGPHMQARDVLRDADLALYEAKRAGRGRFRFFESGMDAQLQKRRELEIDLRRALALKQFELHYQPFLDLNTESVIGFEALLRWNHPVRGEIPPLDFIRITEENGLIVKIGEWVIRTACAAAVTWPGEMIVAVNVSPLQFKADTLLATVASALARSGLPAHRLELEITESALLDDTSNVLATLHALRDLGLKISMDDFGTGYSSLSYLQKFPFNKIKIDRSFVANADADSRAILKAVSGLGSNLGMAITAEGVETAEQLDRIRSQKCTHVQGFFTGRPMSADRVQAFINEGVGNIFDER
nr:EAL domain-containing protein [Sphingomonas bacterium]